MLCADKLFYVLCAAITLYGIMIGIALARMARMETCVRNYANRYADRAEAYCDMGKPGLASATYLESYWCLQEMPGEKFDNYRAKIDRRVDRIEKNRGRYHKWQ